MKFAKTIWVIILVMVSVALAGTLASLFAGPPSKMVKRGEYMVTAGGCGDCHTPMKMGSAGPEPDMSLSLSGHPESLVMPPVPKLPPGPWMGIFSASMTAWSGPWGVSFSANITPDKTTGLGMWTEKTFIDAIRNGRIQGKGRPMLPPMPFPAMARLTDSDLKAIYAYLKSVPKISNKVPAPVAPGEK